MSRKPLIILALTACTVLALATYAPLAMAQDSSDPAVDDSTEMPSATGDQSFKLLRDDDSAARDLNLMKEEAEAWRPGLKTGTIEASLGVGFMDFNSTLLQQDQMIYKYTAESTFWGDVELTGDSAFAPTLRLGYGLTKWLSLEGWGGVAITEYTSTIENRHFRKNEAEPTIVDDPELGEFDAETRSLITLQWGLNAVIYPLAIGGEGTGRFHPYVTGGAGTMWYDINSNFTAGSTSSRDLNFGGGFRLLVDRNVSLRVEVSMHMNELHWTPAQYYTQLDEGTTLVPLNQFPVKESGELDEKAIEVFGKETMNILQWSIGFQGNF